MNILQTHEQVISDYQKYISSFIRISDPQISQVVEEELLRGKLWPEPLLQFNPSFEIHGSCDDLAKSGLIHPDIRHIFRGYQLYRHQVEAISLGVSGRSFIVTSGTGSGKSVTYIGSIFHHLLSNPASEGVAAVVVYPMNALINSQHEEFTRYKNNYEDATGKAFPITFGQYTGQESEEERARMRECPPQVLLTNYMMLELLLTRPRERSIRDAIYRNLRFLVFDELHTYRGRQGADVAMLIRRIRAQSTHDITCVGTSATMVSAGSSIAQRQQVADVAGELFGCPFAPEQVVNETLTRSLASSGALPGSAELAASILAGVSPSGGVEELKRHPVAVWLENAVALELQDGELRRRKPQRIGEIVSALSQASGLEEGQCGAFLADLLQWIGTINKGLQDEGHRYTFLPYKLHQFISQTGSVYTTLDQDERRYVTLEPGIFKQDEEDKKPIFPNVFSRISGHPFVCVSYSGSRLEPREFRNSTGDDTETTDGYLIVGEDIWDPEEDLEYLPDSWLRTTKKGLVPDSKKKPFFPRKVYFDEYGNCSETEPMKWSGWFMRAPLLFDPTSGVFFDAKMNEGTKLTTLGSEGRSTSTTITAFSILNRLDAAGCTSRDQKLLSFTDNRQDAALQAGHFNDFVQVVRLRAGIHKALLTAPDHTLTYATLGEAVFKALNLPFLEYANRASEPEFASIRGAYEESLQKYLFYRAVADLRRSWRIILPNLEQCALLAIDYLHLDEVAASDAFWEDTPLLNALDPAGRREFLTTILDFFRLEYAIHSENYLTPSKIKENEKEFREKLRSPWSLDRDEDLREPFFIRYEPLHRTVKLFSKSMGPASGLGKFIKHHARQRGLEINLKGEEYRTFVLHLMEKLEQADFLKCQMARNEQNTQVPIYRLKIEKILWRLGDGETVKADVIKRRSYKAQAPRPNAFFKEIYSRDFSKSKRLRGEDHTGQLGVEARIDREDRFREGDISALFCSPTMELGIDIGGLTVVHMRNAPPNPANYAQRSGRAGRSGQGALVFTFCSSYSPHDRHYFHNQNDLVAGVVQAPRLDLCNQELLRTHLNALAVSMIGFPGISDGAGARPSLMNLVTDDGNLLPLSPEVLAGLSLSPRAFGEIKAAFSRVVVGLMPDLQERAPWYSDQWIEQNLSRLSDHLDGALDRWRHLYRSARALLTRSTQKIESGTLGLGSDEYRKHKRNQDQATRQLDLLRNSQTRGSLELSEFYPYRYLASEGFLPGYNFTRLPLRIFLPTSESSGEFISRPRPIALREFGPLNVIYHNGRKYRVSQLVVQDAESSLTEATISKKVGYFLTTSQDVCPFTGADLSDNENTEHVHHLLEMTESRAEETDRISCEEEERVSRGYEIKTYFSVDAGQMDRVRRAVARTGEGDYLNIRHMPAARLVHVNYRWRALKANGFPIGMISGDWRGSFPEGDSPLKEPFGLVKLWTSHLADALLVEPIQPLGLKPEGVVTLQYALKRAIEQVFQVEPNEMGVVAVGDPSAPNILLYEAAEGSLGVLSQFVEDIGAFHRVVAQAEELCRFDDGEYRGPASYDDLLSYYNQRDHKIIDRFLIRDALKKLRLCEIEIQANPSFRNYEEHYQALMRGLDPSSSTEQKFLDHLYKRGLRLPDAAQKRVEGIYVQPDFYYEPRIWVFCDGTPHDDPTVQEKDEAQRQAIIARGDEVWVYHYRDNLAEKVAARPDIFRKVK